MQRKATAESEILQQVWAEDDLKLKTEREKMEIEELLLAEGLELMQKNQFEAASKCFKKAIQLDPEDSGLNDLEMACRALQRDPREVVALTLKALALSKLGRMVDALNAYEEITKLHPKSKQAWVDLANFHEYVMKKDIRENTYDRVIINSLETALDLDPSDFRIIFKLALIFGENGDYVKSLYYLERFATIKPFIPKQQRFVEETKKKIAQGQSRPFIDQIENEALTVPGGENVCPKCGEKVPLNLKSCEKCGQLMF